MLIEAVDVPHQRPSVWTMPLAERNAPAKACGVVALIVSPSVHALLISIVDTGASLDFRVFVVNEEEVPIWAEVPAVKDLLPGQCGVGVGIEVLPALVCHGFGLTSMS